MKIVKTTAAAVISSLLIAGAGVPAWSAPTSQGSTVAQATVPQMSIESAISALRPPEATRSNDRPDAERNCRPGHLYTADDVVGDSQACIKGVFSGFGGTHATAAAVPAL